MPRHDRPLHIVGVPRPDHICPSGKCHREATNAAPDDSTDANEALSPSERRTERPRGQSAPPDPGHFASPVEIEDFFTTGEPIHIHPEGTQE